MMWVDSQPNEAAQRLFAQIPCLHGLVQAGLHGMGKYWLNDAERPTYGVLSCGDFVICAGTCGMLANDMLEDALRCNKAKELILYGDAAWLTLIDSRYQVSCEQRWAFVPDDQPKEDHLRKLMAEKSTLRYIAIEHEWISWCRERAWAHDFVSCYDGDECYAAEGMGVLAVADGVVVSGASSYVSYPGGIEIQVQTCDGYERHGYARMAATALILQAHSRGMIATWDAANAASAHIAQQLGYQMIGCYDVRILKR